MDPQENRSRSIAKAVVRALLAGLLVFGLLFYWGGCVETQPPTCYGMFGLYTVPGGDWFALAAGVVTAAVVGVLLLLLPGRRWQRA